MPCLYCRDKRAIARGDLAAPASPVTDSLLGLGVTFEDVAERKRRLKEQYDRDLEAGEATYKGVKGLDVPGIRVIRLSNRMRQLMEDPN